MARFNTTNVRPAVHSPIVARPTPSMATYEGGAGFTRDIKGELFLLAVANMVGDDTYYERGGQRDDRYTQLIHAATKADPKWTADLLGWLRGSANMRTASLVGAAEFVAARLAAGESGLSHQVVSSVLQRADEPGEFLAYWISKHGRAIPKPVKRGVADAAMRLYNERSFLKWDSSARGFRFGDVLDLTHPSTKSERQGHLFEYAISERHNRGESADPNLLPTIASNRTLREFAQENPTLLLNSDRLKQAGMTWEEALSLAGSRVDKAKLWAALIPTMGLMAAIRNLRNFDQAGVSDAFAELVAAKLSDAAEVKASRQFPFRFLSAYKAAPSLRWSWPLEQALNHSLANVPELRGRTLVLVDRSGSMWSPLSARSDLQRCEAAALFGTALAMRSEHADLVQYDHGSVVVPFAKGESVLPIVRDRFTGGGGTNTWAAVRQHYRGHDRVVIVTDEQSHDSYGRDYHPGGFSKDVPIYVWNLAGYRAGSMPSGSGNNHVFGGLTDAAFRMIPLLESGRDGSWPWVA